jgi:adenine-specific DNA-methyltransferase
MVQQITPDDPEFRSTDIIAENLGKIRTLLPDAFTEGKVDFDILRQLLGESVDEGEEKYGLHWHGKRKARQLSLTPSLGTLRPCPEESENWDTTRNLMIEGDNLEVLKLLQKSYAGQVKLIYIDPPYNTGKDFIYRDDFRDGIRNYLITTGQADGSGRKLTSNSESSGRYHTDWLNMMYPRLRVARDLLAPDGVIFISIDDREVQNLRSIGDEIFGPENYIGPVIWKNVTDNNPSRIVIEHEYILAYARDITAVRPVWKGNSSPVKELLTAKGEELVAKYDDPAELQARYTEWYRENKPLLGPLADYKFIDAGGVYAGSRSVHNPGKEGYRYDVIHPVTRKPCKQPLMGYRFPKSTMDDLLRRDLIIFGDDEQKLIELKVYAKSFEEKLSSVYELDGRRGANEWKTLMPAQVGSFTTPKPVRLISDLVTMAAPQGGIVLDFFAGSGTTGHAVMQLNASTHSYRFILVQLPEPISESDKQNEGTIAFCRSQGVPCTIAELTKERLRVAAESIRNSSPDQGGDPGFRVFKLDSSNLKIWDPAPDDLGQMLSDYVDHIIPGRTEDDLFFEVLLKRGVDLCSPAGQREIAGKSVTTVGGMLFTCLTEEINPYVAEDLALGIAAWRDDLAPEVDSIVVFRDSAFSDDIVKANVTEILRQHGFVKIESL